MRGALDVRLLVVALALGALALALPAASTALPAVTPPAVTPPAETPSGADIVARAPVVEPPSVEPLPLPSPDALAGVLEEDVPQVGTGELVVVPGSTPAPGAGPVRTVRVEVEDGVPVDPSVFAEFVLDTLNDPRGWGHGDAMTFARTDGEAEIVVVLASPDTSAEMCRPLRTDGQLSCRVGPRAILTHYRWVQAHPDYGTDRTGYRRYLVNHEVGHVLGHGHEACPGPGVLAPVMQQQSKGLVGCLPNSWPHP